MATRSLTLPILLLLAGLLGNSAQANDWQLCHRSDVKALRFITVGEARLLRLDCNVENLLAAPMRLEFSYNREVPGDAFAKAALNFLEKNLNDRDFEQLKPRFERFNSHYRDIDDGDTYAMIYQDEELLLMLNDEPLTTEQGDRFARAYLRIWFGEKPYSNNLKQALLGNP
ncbi:chalcone isomerase family protein [Alcanivorax jadensis]|uniref:chalcone isomerase family protein n=1 Tax=Alcanivorax jadensis TaxID=64988 RepID=UPI0026EE7B8A|nr:chalcone isomerase family protein [Alcanivorax jadensis]